MRKDDFKKITQKTTGQNRSGNSGLPENLLVDDVSKAATNRKRIKKGVVHSKKWQLMD
jgi:hypothetical protein